MIARIDISSSESISGFDDLSSLQVSLFNDGEHLATNVLSIGDRYTPGDGNAITSPFNLGTGERNQWAWDRGAYLEGQSEFDVTEDLPDTIQIEYVVDGVTYVQSENVTIDELPAPYDPDNGE